jgi:hypothetical protein
MGVPARLSARFYALLENQKAGLALGFILRGFPKSRLSLAAF